MKLSDSIPKDIFSPVKIIFLVEPNSQFSNLILKYGFSIVSSL